jgi:N-acetylneuraminic acid mutarotase
MHRLLLSGLIIAVLPVSSAQAHFLWIVANQPDHPEEIRAYFSETASPDDPELLQRFEGLKAIRLTVGHAGRTTHEIELRRDGAALRGVLAAGHVDPIVATWTYGVVRRENETFLLRYVAKTYPTALSGTWKPVADAKHAPLEITPQVDGENLLLKVTWQGKPAAGSQVVVEGKLLPERIRGETNEDGVFRCRLPHTDLYSIRARHIDQEAGAFEGQNFSQVRTYATLSLPYTAPSVRAVKQALPDLPRGITSFGAAVLGEHVYVYGGHLGEAHHYSLEGQSAELWRLALSTPGARWESLGTGPKLTGLAMVAHAGKLYRVGGFAAKNHSSQQQDLWSQQTFASYDPETRSWTELPPLPEPRSSHDAAVLDGKLYVVGGWKLSGDAPAEWLQTAWVCDLATEPLTWSPLPKPPFQRRALSVAAHRDKLYVIGGMESSGKPTTRVDVFHPATNTWESGPPLIGSGMEGFGNSSFATHGRLLATTMSGSVQELSRDGHRWDVVGQMQNPRFFHRQLVTSQGHLLLIGGANMETGKTQAVELFELSPLRE